MDDESLDTLVKLLILKKLLSDDDDDKKAKALDVGIRVVRGPDWKWENQDGGEGSVGTVVEIGKGDSFPTSVVSVQWDNGVQKKYRAGLNGAYDLRVLDNAPIGVRHKSVNCDSCQKESIFGIRWKCKECDDYDLCSPCYMAGRHDITHQFIRFLTPDSTGSTGVTVPKRQGSVRIQMKGIFPSAKVVRGTDWKWDDQDGGAGKIGRVLALRPWNDDTERNAVRIEWLASNKKDIYRLGCYGKVDVKYVQAAADGFYYREHLPILGDETRAVTTETARSNSVTAEAARSNSVTEESKSRQGSVSENIQPIKYPEPKIIKESALTKGGELLKLTYPSVAVFLEDMKSLLTNSTQWDVEIKCKDGTVKAHKSILSARSEVFAAIFQSDMEENRTGVIKIEDMDTEDLNSFLHFIYTGILPDIELDVVERLYEASDKYAVMSLRSLCAEILAEKFSEENVCDLLVIADAHFDEKFKEKAILYILEKKIPLQKEVWTAFHKACPDLACEILTRYYELQNE